MQDFSAAVGLRAFQQFRWRFPEYWMLAFSAVAWISIFTRQSVPGHHQTALAVWVHWVAMVAAMMFPLKIAEVRRTAEQSLWSRRNRSVAIYLFGYGGAWSVLGVPLAWAYSAFEVPHRLDPMTGAATGLLIAAVWVLSPLKLIATRLCHRSPPLSASGWNADQDCAAYGWRSGWACVLNCWPLMVACWLSGHNVVITLSAFALAWADRHFRKNVRAHAAVMAAMAVVCLAVAVR